MAISILEIDPKELSRQLSELNRKAFDSYYIEFFDTLTEEQKEHYKQLERNNEGVLLFALVAKDGDKIVGWSTSAQKPSGVLHTHVSAVLPEYRGRGIYTEMTQKTIAFAEKNGFASVMSYHQYTNNAVLIAKLKLGFHVVGTVFTHEVGPMVALKYFVDPQLKKLFSYRVGEFKPSDSRYDSIRKALS